MFYAYCWHAYNDFVNRFLFHLHFRPLTTVALANTEHYDEKNRVSAVCDVRFLCRLSTWESPLLLLPLHWRQVRHTCNLG